MPSPSVAGAVDAVSAEVPAQSQRRIAWLDGCRGAAALVVMLSHAYFQPSMGRYGSWLMRHLRLPLLGHFGLTVFIALSGFCLTLPKDRDRIASFQEFSSRRCRRILPPYYAALLLSVLFIGAIADRPTGTIWDQALPLTWAVFVKHVLLIQNFPSHEPGGSINYVLWTVALEFQLYLLLPLILASLRRLGVGATLAWAILPGIAMPALALSSFALAPWYLGVFALGCVAGRQRAAPSSTPPLSPKLQAWVGGALGMATLALALSQTPASANRNMPYYDLALGLALALWLGSSGASAETAPRGVRRALSWPPLVALGGYSYSLYLVHAPLLHSSWLLLHRWSDTHAELTFALLVAAMPLILGGAYLFHLAFERPFVRAGGQNSRRALADTNER